MAVHRGSLAKGRGRHCLAPNPIAKARGKNASCRWRTEFVPFCPLLIPRLRRLAGIGLATQLLAMFPANANRRARPSHSVAAADAAPEYERPSNWLSSPRSG
jgi:hypothetical protein